MENFRDRKNKIYYEREQTEKIRDTINDYFEIVTNQATKQEEFIKSNAYNSVYEAEIHEMETNNRRLSDLYQSFQEDIHLHLNKLNLQESELSKEESNCSHDE